MKRHLKRPLLSAVSGLTGRTAVLLPAQASGRDAILAVRAPYRVDSGVLTVRFDCESAGRLVAKFEPRGSAAGWTSDAAAYAGPSTMTLDLASGRVELDGRALGSVSGGAAVECRRFSWLFTLETSTRTFERRTGHYVPRAGLPVDSAYYNGEDYRDYEAESGAVHAEVTALARAHHARGPALEIGCATGGTVAALLDAGIDAYGVDFSAWAVEQATARVGAGRVAHGDVESDVIPDTIARRAPFHTLVLASVFEHFRHPFAVLEQLTRLTAPGALLILMTSNADSLTHRIFGADWEGYFDWTHHGVDAVSAATVREGLRRLGWRIEQMTTHHVWDGSDDPTRATLRDWFSADARFERLLVERDLGDFITCVAVRD
jgi:2-polyprenyl-3-methyl-5-hydroxy-6-metoxy-1,4-benzoquinol methylase